MSFFDSVKKVLDKLTSVAKDMSTGTVSVGFLDSGITEERTGERIVDVAFWNEFGVPENNQPARPFFRRMVAKESDNWPKRIKELTLQYKWNSNKILDIMGQEISEQLKESILELMEPELSPKTIAKKGFSKPLIETGTMLESVDYEVKKASLPFSNVKLNPIIPSKNNDAD